MAAASLSPLASSVEKANGAKLSRLLIDGGTTVLRKTFDKCYPPVNLSAGLNANYSILKTLLKKKVLRAAQWDSLFPASGATPDSNTFDITLLFVLLTNICGLSPPLSGWHAKPSPSDVSLEANLARVKFFRNELYGHVSTTGIDTPTFCSLWQEISAVLVALGLDQVKIDRLKAENCAEEDYIDVLLEWAENEENIKSQLAAIHRLQSKTQQSIEELRLTQLEDGETFQNTTSMLKVVHQVQTKTQQIVEGAAKNQDEHFDNLQASLQELREAVGGFSEGGNTNNKEDEVLRKLAKSEFKGDIEFHVQRFQEDTREWVFSRVQNWLDDRNSENRVMVICGNAGMGKSVISAVVCQRMQDVGRLCGSHFIQHNNVRYRKPQLMLQSLASHMCYVLPEFKGALVEQLKRNVGKDLNNMGVEELFAVLFKEPLTTVADPGRNMLIVIDGLDESDYQDRNELLDVIANHFFKLPIWIRFLVTSRPERNIAEALKHLRPFQLESNDEQNLNDIKRFIGKRLQCIPEAENKNNIVENLTAKSEGIMLYAYFLLLYIEEVPSVLKQGNVEGSIPLGISSVYSSYFKRLGNELVTELGIKENNFLNLLSAITAAREPLPIDFVSQVLVPGTKSVATKRKVLKAISSVSSLLPVRDYRLHIFHKSVKDWLTDDSCYGEHDFIVDEKEGHRILSDLCTDEFDIFIQRGALKDVNVTQFSDKARYALEHGVRHMLELEEVAGRCGFEEIVKKYVLNLELVFAKLCVNSRMATEDIFVVQKQERFISLRRETKELVETLLLVLRKNSWLLRELPYVFLQTVVNDGGSQLSLEARKLLREKYPEISYMECTDKNKQQSAVEARFHCSTKVACFDVSPREDYMVCECSDETIQLWSLKTGIRKWTRPVLVKKLYSCGAYYSVRSDVPDDWSDRWSIRWSDLWLDRLSNEDYSHPLSLYHSVVFHPNGKFVLPGNLVEVYTIDGEQTQLLSSSDCRFSSCAFIGENSRILTSVLDNAKSLVVWDLSNGGEISRITRNEDIVCFQCSPDEKLLAISHSTGFICVLDLKNEFAELATISTAFPCGFINFSAENRDFVALYLSPSRKCLSRYSIAPGNVFQKVGGFESGAFHFNAREPFLVGDATNSLADVLKKINPFWEAGLLVQLSKDYALMGSPSLHFVSLINLDKLGEVLQEPKTFVREITFSTNGEILYVVREAPKWTVSAPSGLKRLWTEDMTYRSTVTVWECSSWKMKAKKHFFLRALVPVKDGVVVVRNKPRRDLTQIELWNVELTSCRRLWENLEGTRKVLSISDEQVACCRDEYVTVLSASGDLLKTICIEHEFQCIHAISRDYQILTQVVEIDFDSGEYRCTLRASNAPSSWEILWTDNFDDNCGPPRAIFSPKGEYCVIWSYFLVQVYHAASGELLCRLFERREVVECRFITDLELVVYSSESHGNFLRLFNVRSGEHLNTLELEERPVCFEVCPRSLHVAVAFRDCEVKLIQVHLSRSKSANEPVEIKKSSQKTSCLPCVIT